jgi:DNA-directed RNA polymerase specialized sigma24 family protein
MPESGLDVDLLEALQELTDLQREVVVLRFVADLPLRDVARLTGRPVPAVKRLQARGLERLAHRLSAPARSGAAGAAGAAGASDCPGERAT